MKGYITIIMLVLGSLLMALPKNGEDNNPKMINYATHTAGSLSLDTSNMGYISNLTYPQRNSTLLYKGSQWFSAKRYRRDELGRLLFWLSPNPTASNCIVVTIDDSLWTPNLKIVTDSLSTVGTDGDDDLTEFLPAYNILNQFNPEVPNMQYNALDKVLKSILGLPSPRPFEIPDPLGNYCFSTPLNTPFATPGFETHSAYFYDYCPFGTPGDRDWGSSSNYSTHYPLGVAVHRESYSWPLQNYDKMFIIKNTVYNTSEIDTLYDVAISEFADFDIRPYSQSAEGITDDVSGYVKGIGYEFAYSRDFDGDGGVTDFVMGHKIIVPQQNLNHSAWYWRLGQAPDDHNPHNLSPSGRTSNSKYWLTTGRNPDTSKYTYLRPVQDDILQWEQPTPTDTRFLNTLFGNIPTASNPNPDGRLHLAPMASLTYYSVYFMGDDLDDLKAKSIALESFINGGFNLGDVSGLTCIPYLYDPSVLLPDIFRLIWQSYSNPDHFEVKYKEFGEPASQWISINLPGASRSFNLVGADPEAWYEIKLGSVYNPGPNEVYLESETKLVCINNIVDNEDLVQSPALALGNYPNPFKPSTTVEFQLKQAGNTKVIVYNVKGQEVRVLADTYLPAGSHKLQWDGLDSCHKPCASGVYYLQLNSGKQSATRKLLLMK